MYKYVIEHVQLQMYVLCGADAVLQQSFILVNI